MRLGGVLGAFFALLLNKLLPNYLLGIPFMALEKMIHLCINCV